MNTPNDEPRPLERRVGRRTGKEWLLLLAFAFRFWLLTIHGNTRSIAIATYGPKLFISTKITKDIKMKNDYKIFSGKCPECGSSDYKGSLRIYENGSIMCFLCLTHSKIRYRNILVHSEFHSTMPHMQFLQESG